MNIDDIITKINNMSSGEYIKTRLKDDGINDSTINMILTMFDKDLNDIKKVQEYEDLYQGVLKLY